MLRLIVRLLLGGFALALAILFASFVLGAGFFVDPALRSASLAFLRVGFGLWDLLYGFSLATLLDRIGSFFKVLLLVVTVPLALTALFGETLRLHALAWYGGASGLLSAALPLASRCRAQKRARRPRRCWRRAALSAPCS